MSAQAAARALGARIGAGAALWLTLAVFAIALGAVWIPPAEALRALVGGPGGGAEDWRALVIWQVRLPRTILAGLGGASLAVAGTALQGLFRNPMADPGVLGVSAGGALGAVLAIYGATFLPPALGAGAGALLGALAAAFVVYALAMRAGRASTETLLLAGIAVSGFAAALTSLVLSLALAEWELGREMIQWLMGGLERASWKDVGLLAVPVAVGTAGLALEARQLDVLLTGEDAARALGVDVERVTRRVLVLTSLLTAACVSVMGVVAFVGLLVPHITRRFVGPRHGAVFAAGALGGAVVLTAADLVSRMLPGSGLRLGVVTSLLGAPFFLSLLLARGRGARGDT